MTSKLHFSHKHLENQNKKYFSICLANTVYVAYIFLGTGLEYLWPGSTKQELAFGQSFILYKSKSNNTNHNPYFLLNHPQTLYERIPLFSDTREKKNPVYYPNKIQK